jgi:hypothetical protein
MVLWSFRVAVAGTRFLGGSTTLPRKTDQHRAQSNAQEEKSNDLINCNANGKVQTVFLSSCRAA